MFLILVDNQVIMAGHEDDIEYMIRKLIATNELNGLKKTVKNAVLNIKKPS